MFYFVTVHAWTVFQLCFFLYRQIRIDKLVDKWSGSIEIGVTTHNPNNLDYPATMTNLRSGLI